MDHNKLWKILKKMGIPDHLTCLLRNLYSGQEATVRAGHGTFPGGSAIFELAPAQAPRLQKLLQSLGFVSGVIRDLAGRDRFVTAEKK